MKRARHKNKPGPRHKRGAGTAVRAFLSHNRLFGALEAETSQYVLWAPVGLGAGIILYFSLKFEPGLMLPLAVFLGGFALWFVWRPGAIAKFLILGLALMGLGFMAAGMRTLNVTAPRISAELGPVALSGRVLLVEPVKDNQTRVTLGALAIEGLSPAETPKSIRLTVRTGLQHIHPGVMATTLAVLLPPSPPTMPGGFDFARLAFFQGLGAVGYTLRPLVGKPEEDAGFSINDLRLNVAERVRTRVEGPSGAIGAALLTGLRRAIPEDVNEAMRRSGLAHLLAISGLHMALMTGIIFFTIRAALAAVPTLALRLPLKKITALLAFFGALGYLALSGMAISTQRAFFMVSIVLLAIVLERRALSMRLVAMAAFVILLVQPESLLSASFQMSFAAVIGLVAGFRAVRGRVGFLTRRRSLVQILMFYLASIMFSTLIAEVTIGPIAAYHFHRFNAYGLIANLVAVPVMGFWVMPLLLISLVLMPFGLEGFSLILAGQGLDIIVGTARLVSDLPGASVMMAAVPVAALVLYWAGGLWLALWRDTRLRLLGLIPLLLLLSSPFWSKPAQMLIAPEGELIAIRASAGRASAGRASDAKDGGGERYYFSSRRTARFARERWQESAGQAEAPLLSELNHLPGNGFYRCDALGCLYGPPNARTSDGGIGDAEALLIAMPGTEQGFEEDCRRADVIISRFRAPRGCDGPGLVIDRARLRAYGGHALWIDEEGGLKVRSVEEVRGNRPWTWGSEK